MKPLRESPLIDSKEACRMLGIQRFTLSRLVHKNMIPYVLMGTGKRKLTVRFREEELEAWVSRRSRGPGGVPRNASVGHMNGAHEPNERNLNGQQLNQRTERVI